MKDRRTNLLSLLRQGEVVRTGFGCLLLGALSLSAQAQTEQSPSDCVEGLARRSKTKTLSIYTEGGLSWASGLWYPNVDAKRSYKQSPAVGAGIDLTIRPWVRVGAEYLWSRYRREQRMSALDPASMPSKAYGNYVVNYHNIKLGGGVNLMELWSKRRAQWFNVWLSTGIGYMNARGNEYGLYLSSTRSENGQTSPISGNLSLSNESNVTIESKVLANNQHSSFRRFYIPASLHLEFDLTSQLALGLKGEVDWLLARKAVAPRQLAFALATVRYSFSMSKAKALSHYYGAELGKLNTQVNDLRQQVATEQARSSAAEMSLRQAQEASAELQRELDECRASKAEVASEVLTHFVQFAHNSSYFDREERERLVAFAKSVKGRKLSLIAEASTPGDKAYNQLLSERRLQRVIEALIAEGFAPEDLMPQTAIGEDKGIPTAEGRRVTITVN